jgi:filamentous hemagglutinin
LNPDHPRGKHKARVFATLGYTVENADELRAALLEAAASADAQSTASDEFGDRYAIEFEIRGPRGSGVIRSTWIVRRGETSPRLTSCFVK